MPSGIKDVKACRCEVRNVPAGQTCASQKKISLWTKRNLEAIRRRRRKPEKVAKSEGPSRCTPSIHRFNTTSRLLRESMYEAARVAQQAQAFFKAHCSDSGQANSSVTTGNGILGADTKIPYPDDRIRSSPSG